MVSSPTENKLSFLRSKHLTPEEIDIAFARSGSPSTALSLSPVHSPPASAPQHQQQHQQHQHQQQQQQQQPPFYGQYQAQPYGWQPPPLEPPKRDWRDWFIMATVMGGVGYGLYFITKVRDASIHQTSRHVTSRHVLSRVRANLDNSAISIP